jgi:hypothetical protein
MSSNDVIEKNDVEESSGGTDAVPAMFPAASIFSAFMQFSDLTVDQVCGLLNHLNLGRYSALFKANELDGRKLSFVETIENFANMDVEIPYASFRALMSAVESYSAVGVTRDEAEAWHLSAVEKAC